MSLVSSALKAPLTIANAIKKASRATGADFSYLMNTAARESSFDKGAKAKTSSAAGLFQFIEGTWLQMVKEVGNKFGLDKYTPHIFTTRSGKYYVPNQKLRGEILQLRHNPEVSAMMAGEFTKQNSEFIESELGRKPSEGELYVAHFLGAKGASDLISLADSRPNARADRHFPKAARANRSIFYSRGRPKSVAQVYKTLVRDHAKLQATAKATPADSTAIPATAAPPGKVAGVSATAPQIANRVDKSQQPVAAGAENVPIPIQKATLKQGLAVKRRELESIGPGVDTAIIEPLPQKRSIGLLGHKGSPIAPSKKVAALPHNNLKVSPKETGPSRELRSIDGSRGIGTWTTIVNPPDAQLPPPPQSSPAHSASDANSQVEKRGRAENGDRPAKRKTAARAPRLLEQSTQRNTTSTAVRTAAAFSPWQRMSLYGN